MSIKCGAEVPSGWRCLNTDWVETQKLGGLLLVGKAGVYCGKGSVSIQEVVNPGDSNFPSHPGSL